MTASVPKIILDTDPGGDDIFAMLWLHSLVKQGLAELVAITTAEGNVSAQQTFISANKILHLVGLKSISVGRGVSVHQPTIGDASHIHGTDGMGNLSSLLPDIDRSFDQAPASDDLLIDTLTASPDEITILAIAPFNNLAAAEAKKPGILKRAKEIVLMAGAFQHAGNVTPHAEFNVVYNPEAAQTVLDSRADIVIVPLDVTSQLIFTEAMGQTVNQANPKSAIAHFLSSLTNFMVSTALQYRETQGVRGFLVHDAATVGYLFYPETLQMRRAKVSVELSGKHTRGQTLVDNRHGAKAGANSWIVTQVDAPNFFMSCVEDLKALVAQNA